MCFMNSYLSEYGLEKCYIDENLLSIPFSYLAVITLIITTTFKYPDALGYA